MDDDTLQQEFNNKQEILTELRRRLQILEKQAAREGSSAPAKLQMDIEDLKVEIEKLNVELQELDKLLKGELFFFQKNHEIRLLLDEIRIAIKFGDKQHVQKLVNELKQKHQLSVEQQIIIDELTTKNDDIHLHYLITTRSGSEYPEWRFDRPSKFINEHIAWLLHPKRCRKLTIELLADLLRYNDILQLLEPVVLNRIIEEIRLCTRPIPPPYFRDIGVEDLEGYVDALKIGEYFHKEEISSLITIVGDSKCGKTAALRYLQVVHFSDNIFYVYLSIGDYQNQDMINLIEQRMVEILRDILVRYIYVVKYLDTRVLDIVKDIIEKVDNVFIKYQAIGIDLIDKLKDLSGKAVDETTKRSLDSLITSLRMNALITQQMPSDTGNAVVMDNIGDILKLIKYSTVCISIDAAASTFDPVPLRNLLELYLPQRVLLRVAYKERPGQPRGESKELVWSYETLQAIFNTIAGDINRFTYPEIRAALVRELRVPGDFHPWLAAFQESYPEQDVKPECWYLVAAAMHRARARRDPRATDWLMEDWHHAKLLLQSEGSGP